MNVSELDCPQYVCFNSEEFLRNASRYSVDSLVNREEPRIENLSAISGLLSPTDESCEEKVSMESTRYDYTETPSSNTDQENIGDLTNATDCFPIMQARITSGAAISGLLSPTDESCEEKVSMESTRYDYTETPSSNTDQENIGDLTNATDCFPIMQARITSGAAKRNTMRVTVPKPFQFQTDKRLKSKTTDEINIYEKKDFVSELRHNSVLKPHKQPHLTRPQPFNLTEAKKRKYEDPYLSMAEKIAAFQKKTPERYHSSSNKEYQPQAHWNPPKLVAKTPNLQACKRRRVAHVISKEEQENKEIEEMKAYEFHARPVDPKIYRQPLALRSQPTNKTKPKDFRLKTTQRAVMHLRSRTKSNKEKFVFKARPVPKAILSGPTAQEELLQQKEAQKKRTSSAPSVPCVPYVKRRTEIQPFSFDKADRERFAEKEKKIQEEIERESKPFVFHAQPILEPPPLPVIPKQPPTEVKPFNFLLDNRVLKSNYLSFDTNNTTFKARPATVLRKEPFIPEKPPKQEIEIKEFNLYTDKRASDRQHLKEIQEQEEQAMQQALMEQKARDEERERQELIQLRREIVHKANPIRHYKPVELQPSSIPLTQPESPNFETDKRIQKRHDQSSST
ncbi:hypothetical protein JTE90_017567 [Oedothorax gibbosus]|uniref:Targeting protein for Xklp2 n=1 Tax=Oedothorax gibbosus TaxID=931172 RepID=A0AAV6UPD7_9ARAC|nr:hypothetical protein JTE90_017567 [Oedothorax gibbosus]